MAESYSVNFVSVVRTLGRIANQREFISPSFRCPPPSAKFQRSMRNLGEGEITISIVIRERPWLAVLADIVEGFVIANKSLERESELRNLLWDSIASNNLQKTEYETQRPPNQFISSAA